MSPLGSGSHSPFPLHVAELGLVSSHPGGQLNMIDLPSIGRSGESTLTLGTESLLNKESLLMVNNSSGYPQLTV